MSDAWSIKAIQDLAIESDPWDKKNLYATDSDKCPSGVYYQLMGEQPTKSDKPESKRRMEVGQMVELNQVKKLRSLGILVEAQRRIYDEEYDVSGRHDGLVISPTQCSAKAKEMIARKVEIFNKIEALEKGHWSWINLYNTGETTLEKLLEMQASIFRDKTALYSEEAELNKQLLQPDPENHFILMEIKSIVEKGFQWRAKEGVPMESHRNQIMFYLWKMREEIPNLEGRVIYVDTSYQHLLEFNVEYDEDVMTDLKRFWSMMNEAKKNKVPPQPCPDIVQNTMTGKWQVNFKADWCRYHILCTGDANWFIKAQEKVEQLNGKKVYKRK